MEKIDFSAVLKRANAHIDKYPELHKKAKKEQEDTEEEQRQLQRQRAFENSGLPINFYGTELPTVKSRNTKQALLLNILSSWSTEDDFRLPYVFGPPGTGKSFFAKAFGGSAIRNGNHSVLFLRMSNFVIQYRDFNQTENLNTLTAPNILIIDDFCSHNSTKHIVEIIHAAIDFRLDHQKPTLITSNIAMNKISSFLYKTGKTNGVTKIMCDSIEDRVFDLCSICYLDGTSIREENATIRHKQRMGKE